MMTTDNLVYSNRLRVAKELSDAALQVHPKTSEVMAFFSNNATFKRYNLEVGKKVASLVCKIWTANRIIAFEDTPLIYFQQNDQGILWSFESIQQRKNLLPNFIRPAPAHWCRINFTAQLFFTGSGDNTRISGISVIKREKRPLHQGYITSV
jgi:hypothetical protein